MEVKDENDRLKRGRYFEQEGNVPAATAKKTYTYNGSDEGCKN